MKLFQRQWLKKISTLLEVSAPDPDQLLRRVQRMERDLVLPVKAVVIAALVYFLYFPRWVDVPMSTLDVAVEDLQYFLWGYVPLNFFIAILLLLINRLPPALIQWSVFASCLVDGLFLAALTLLTGGYDSILFWLFLGLIARNAISVPATTSQLALNFSISLCYVLAGVLDVAIHQTQIQNFPGEPNRPLALDESGATESILLRLIMLWLMTLCCYGVTVLFEKQRRALEEAQEFTLRQERLRSAGRLAAEITHQIKNPLGIINNAVFSLKRALASGKKDVDQQIQIIQEEVERSDRIVTQLMGYAQLAEGRVERLDVIPELERAIEQVFPPAAAYEIQIHRDYDTHLPSLPMQRSHLAEIFVNLFQNAREALNGNGNIFVSVRLQPNYYVEIIIRDDGQGIAAENLEKIFDAYYTQKEKGTGLGLAIVKHNVELYDGSVHVESELGKGACFTVIFPARTLERLARQI